MSIEKPQPIELPSDEEDLDFETPAESTARLSEAYRLEQEAAQADPQLPEPVSEEGKTPEREAFEQHVEGRIEAFDGAHFKSSLDGVDTIFTVRPRSREGQPAPENLLNIGIIYDKDLVSKRSGGRKLPVSSILSLYEHARLGGDVRKELRDRGATREDILNEFLEFATLYGQKPPEEVLKNWHGYYNKMLPPDAGAYYPPTGLDRDRTPRYFDRERLEFLREIMQHPRALFGLVEKTGKKPHESDHAIVFDGLVLIENPTTEHAAYLVKTEPFNPEDVPKEKNAFDQWLQARGFTNLLGMTRSELRNRFVVQSRRHEGDWKEDLRKKIDGFLP